MESIIIKVINYFVPIVLGFCVGVIKNYSKKNKAISNALMIMLQANLSNAFFVYSSKKQIPDYIYKNWLTMLKEYENLGGDDYVHDLSKKMESWEIVRTDIHFK